MKKLIFKLSKLNLEPKVLTWIKAFLTNRSQFVYVNGIVSSIAQVNYGVPQGSVLGPILFLIYINDFTTHYTSSMSMFVDDGVIYRNITNANNSL